MKGKKKVSDAFFFLHIVRLQGLKKWLHMNAKHLVSRMGHIYHLYSYLAPFVVSPLVAMSLLTRLYL